MVGWLVGWLACLFVWLYENYLISIFGRVDCVHVSFSDKEVRSLYIGALPATHIFELEVASLVGLGIRI